jgi:hypothetical protein
MTTLTLRYQRGHFFVVGPDTSIKFKSRREARDCCAEHHPGSPIKEIGATPARLGVVFFHDTVGGGIYALRPRSQNQSIVRHLFA